MINIICKTNKPIKLYNFDSSKVKTMAIKFKNINELLNFVNFYYIGWYGVKE